MWQPDSELVSDRLVEYYRKSNYGTDHYYPVNQLGELIIDIGNVKTLSPYLMQRLSAKYNIIFVEVLEPREER